MAHEEVPKLANCASRRALLTNGLWGREVSYKGPARREEGGGEGGLGDSGINFLQSHDSGSYDMYKLGGAYFSTCTVHV